MTRFASADNASEAAQSSIVMCVLIDLDFSSGHLYVHDGIGTITFGGHDYLGVGQFGGIDGAVQDSLEVIARPIKLVLSGVDSALMSSAMTEDYQNRAVVIYLGFFDKSTNQLVDTPETAWEGRMDYMEVEMSSGSGTIKVNCEHRLRREPRISRYTDEDQQVAYPGDLFFNLIPYIAGFKSQWGDQPSSFSSAPGEQWGPAGKQGRRRGG